MRRLLALYERRPEFYSRQTVASWVFHDALNSLYTLLDENLDLLCHKARYFEDFWRRIDNIEQLFRGGF